jgi:hypothetical protein
MIGLIRHFFDNVAQVGKVLQEFADATGGVGLLGERGAAIDGHLQEGAQSLFGLFVCHSIAFYRYRIGM